MDEYYQKLLEASEYIRSRAGSQYDVAVILGSGWGKVLDGLIDAVEIPYEDIPGFPETSVKGHAGVLMSGTLGGKRVLAMKGRFHYYEGYDISQVVFPVRVMKMLGANNIIITNAAGGINRDFKPGDIMVIKDHLSFFAPSPLRGKNIEEFGPRFPDMSDAYDKEMIRIAHDSARSLGIDLKEGIYAFMRGPMYETPAEIRALALMGADTVGMSTVPEVITARHAGMRVLGISCIANMAAGILDQPISHEEVIEAAKKAEGKFVALIGSIVKSMPADS